MGREGEREGEKHQCIVTYLSHTPNWGPGPQPRHVPWLGIEPVTLWFIGPCSIHWATPARAMISNIFRAIKQRPGCLQHHHWGALSLIGWPQRKKRHPQLQRAFGTDGQLRCRSDTSQLGSRHDRFQYSQALLGILAERDLRDHLFLII